LSSYAETATFCETVGFLVLVRLSYIFLGAAKNNVIKIIECSSCAASSFLFKEQLVIQIGSKEIEFICSIEVVVHYMRGRMW
jgi:hypothetical protein